MSETVIASPALTGTPTAPTPPPGDNSPLVATTAFVTAAVAAGSSGESAPAPVPGGFTPYITPADYGAEGDGQMSSTSPGTDDHVEMQKAIDAAVESNTPLYLGGKGYFIGDTRIGRTDAGSLTIVGPGTIYWRRGAQSSAFIFAPPAGVEKTVTGISTQLIPNNTMSSATPVSRLSMAAGDEKSFAEGDVVIVHSTDAVLMDSQNGQVKRGEMALITSLAPGYIYLNLILEYEFKTSPKIVRLDQDSKLRTYGGVKFRCVDDGMAKTGEDGMGGRGIATMLIVGANAPDIEVEVDSAPNRALMVVGCYRPRVDVQAWHISDFNSNAGYAYGCSVAGCTRHGDVKVTGGWLRHAFTTNVYPFPGGEHGCAAAWKGGPRDIAVTGDVTRCGAAAWDTHLEAFDIHFYDISADGSAPEDANTDQSSRYFLQDRGVRTTVHGIKQRGFPNLIYIYPCDPGYNYTARYRGITASGDPAVNAALGSNQALLTIAANGATKAGRMTVEISDGSAEGMSLNLGATQPKIVFSNFRFVNFSLMRHNNSTTAEYHNCTRVNTTPNAQEAMRWTSGGAAKVFNMGFIGRYENNACLRHSGGSGTVTIDFANISSDQSHAVIQVAAGGALVATDRTTTTIIKG